MTLFYAPHITPPLHHFDREESGHMVRVMRLKEGDAVHLTDGKGRLYTCTITQADPKRCEVSLDTHTFAPPSAHPLHIAIAPTKNASRFEWFLEKATEIGVDAITPLLCFRSERRVVKTDRLNKILVAAMKQSLQPWLPQLHEPTPFNELIRQHLPGQGFIASCPAAPEAHLHRAIIPGKPALILIGPEGDFSPEEMAEAATAGFTPVSLGPSRLRTETAGLVACMAFQLLNMNFKQPHMT